MLPGIFCYLWTEPDWLCEPQFKIFCLAEMNVCWLRSDIKLTDMRVESIITCNYWQENKWRFPKMLNCSFNINDDLSTNVGEKACMKMKPCKCSKDKMQAWNECFPSSLLLFFVLKLRSPALFSSWKGSLSGRYTISLKAALSQRIFNFAFLSSSIIYVLVWICECYIFR